jgi:hypothetical protein
VEDNIGVESHLRRNHMKMWNRKMVVSKSASINSQAYRENKQRARKDLTGRVEDILPLVTTDTEAVLVEAGLVGLAPLLLGLSAAAIATSTTRHLLVGRGHGRASKASWALSEMLTAGARPCPRISHVAPVHQFLLPPTLG